jgi:Fe-S cluster biogenesis protein NfuA/nitrite reductase/ring-hydroxylating ferredoxin subunit
MAQRAGVASGGATSAAARIDSLLGEFSADPVAAERAEELVRTLVAFYDDGLGRFTELIAERDDGEEIMRVAAADKIVAGMLVLHDLHPDTTEERVSAALERVRPYLGSHAGDVDLLGVGDDGVVRLRLAGSCHGCPSSAVTVKLAIEQAIEEAAPEVVRVEVEGVAAAPLPRGVGGPGGRTMLPMLGTPASAPAGPTRTWISLDSTADVAPGTLAAMAIGGANTILANIDGSLYAYRDRCPGCGVPVHTGAIEGDLLRCTGCAQAYDLRRAGVGTDRIDLHLEPLPLLAEDGTVRVAVPVGSAS